MRPLLAVSLAASLAAFGCTTNLNPGSGTPTRIGPELRTAPTSGVTSGSERPLPPPMTSSYTRAEAVQTVTPRTIRRSAEEAAAIMAGHQAVRGRYLGPSNPGTTVRAYASDGAGGFLNPAMLTNPQSTVNSSISSGPTAAINSGGAGAVTGVATSGVTAGAVITGTGTTTAAATTGATTPAGALATARPAVTDSVAANPTVTSASGAAPTPLTATSAATRTTGATPTAATTTTAAATSAATVTSAGNGSSVRILRSTNGNVTITNAGGATARVP